MFPSKKLSIFQYALKSRSKAKDKKEHWLDYSEEKYGKKLVDDIKATLKVLVLYIPLPVFWSLFDQQGTGWTFQARRMDGEIGFYTILPDQMQVINPLLILAFIPLFQYVFYPAMNKCNFLTTPLKRLTAGGVLVSISFVISASISLALESQYPKAPAVNNGHLRIYNNMNCTMTLSIDELQDKVTIKPMGYYENIDLNVNGKKDLKYSYNCDRIEETGTFTVQEKKAIGYYHNGTMLTKFEDDVQKSDDGEPRVRQVFYLFFFYKLKLTYTCFHIEH